MNIGDDVGNSKARWVRVSVEMLGHPALDHGPYDRRSAWLWLITNAALKDHKANHKGAAVNIKRGQVFAGRDYLAKVWRWSPQNVRTFLRFLVSENMVEINQSNGHYANVLTICNYEKYQTPEKVRNQSDNQSLTSAQPVPNQTTTKDTKDTIDNTPLPPKGGPTPGDAIKAFHAYNDTALRCGLQQAKSLTPDRQRRLIARLRDYGLDGWSVALANIERSSFLTGKNDNGWRADLDFLLQAKSFNKVHDGSYGNGRHSAQQATVIPLAPKDPYRFEDSDYALKIARELGVAVDG
jgi:hypothetical protein